MNIFCPDAILCAFLYANLLLNVMPGRERTRLIDQSFAYVAHTIRQGLKVPFLCDVFSVYKQFTTITHTVFPRPQTTTASRDVNFIVSLRVCVAAQFCEFFISQNKFCFGDTNVWMAKREIIDVIIDEITWFQIVNYGLWSWHWGEKNFV